MPNPLYKQLGGQVQQPPMSQDPMGIFLAQYQQLKNTIKGDPKQMVEQLISSGQMSRAEFERYAQSANQLLRFVPK